MASGRPAIQEFGPMHFYSVNDNPSHVNQLCLPSSESAYEAWTEWVTEMPTSTLSVMADMVKVLEA
jgi:hypothetical protein